jgi:tRNA(Ile)-lysidine synthase
MNEASPPGISPIPSDAETRGVLVGFSGGLDSGVLLHLLALQPAMRERGLRAIHVHHGLHADADAWAAHCREICLSLDVPLQVAHVEVARDSGHGVEAAARAARRRALADALNENEVLALAHHRDDQAETFLLRALRASGTDGLAAMRAWRRFGHAWLWRPLLETPRSALLAYAQAHGFRWIDDPSNRDVDYDRNFLRHRVLPLLRERWPEAEAALARSAQLSGETQALLEEGDAAALASARTLDPQVLSTPRLLALPRARRARVLRRWIESLALPPLPAQGVSQIETVLLTAADDRESEFAWHGAIIRRWRDLLHASAQCAPLPEDWHVAWDGRAPLVLPDGGSLFLERAALEGMEPEGAGGFESPLEAGTRRGGERIVLPGRTHSHALKHVLQDLGVPPWEREHLPILRNAAGEVLAAGDLVYSATFDAWLRANGARLCWRTPAAPAPAARDAAPGLT